MSDKTQVMESIKEALKKKGKHKKKILTYIFDLRTKEEYQDLSDSEFYDIVGEVFKSNPENFMDYIYTDLRKKFRKLYGNEKLKEMEKYIIKNFSLYEREQILYECNGDIKESNIPYKLPFDMKIARTPVKVSVNGRIYVTNYRIIAHGKLSVSGGRWGGFGYFVAGGSKRDKGKAGVIEGSLTQELPCYGYQFITTNHVSLCLRETAYRIKYNVIVDKVENISNASFLKQERALVQAKRKVNITLAEPKKEEINHLFEILCKNVYQTLNSFYEIHEMGLNKKLKRNEFLLRLRGIFDSEEYHQLSDSECIDIVKEVYNLDPEFFMTMIYTKMMSWTFHGGPSFQNMKDDLIKLIDNLKKETLRKEEVLDKEVSEKARGFIQPSIDTIENELKAEVVEPTPSITDEKKEKSVKSCPYCGQELSLEAKFCIKCGEKVEKLQPIPVITDEKIEKPVIAEEVKPRLFISDKKKEKPKEVSYNCKFCGYKLNKKATVCPQCGAKVKKN